MKRYLPILFIIACFSCLQEDPDALEPTTSSAEAEWEHIDSLDGLSPGIVLDIYYDEPNYWVATTNGLTLYDGDDFYRFTENDVLVDRYVTSIARDNDGLIWFGTYGGASVYDENQNQWYTVEQISGFDWQITAMEELENGDLLIGTSTLGLIIYDGNGYFQVFDNSCSECNLITTIFEDSEENIWVGSEFDLKMYDDDFDLEEQYTNDLAGDHVLAIHEDPLGRTWVGFNDTNEITRINLSNEDFHDVTIVDAYPRTPVYGFVTGPDDQLWVGSFFNGVLRYDGGLIRSVFGGPDEDRYILVIKEINDQILIGTDDGVYIYTAP